MAKGPRSEETTNEHRSGRNNNDAPSVKEVEPNSLSLTVVGESFSCENSFGAWPVP